uniref:39S ribosomal protein L41, mitochondrial n=1 Tax=Strongyloides papillosus TaxID=174720 RepID=A0A0N5C4B7_STREA
MSATAFSGGRALNNKKYKILPNGRRIYFLYRPGVSIPFIANAPASEEELVPKYSKNFNKNIVVKKEHHFSHLLRQPIMSMSQWWNFEEDNRYRKP